MEETVWLVALPVSKRLKGKLLPQFFLWMTFLRHRTRSAELFALGHKTWAVWVLNRLQ